MNDQTKAAVEMTEEAVRGHRTTGARLGVWDEHDTTNHGVAQDKRTGDAFPMMMLTRRLVLNDPRYAMKGFMVCDMASDDVRSMIVEVAYAPVEGGFKPTMFFHKEIVLSDRPDWPQKTVSGTNENDAELVARGEEFKQLMALGIRAAERHRDLAAPAETVHQCNEPSCSGNGKLPSQIFGPNEVTYIDLNGAAPAAGTAIH